ncbi:MAG: hypothetical protein ACYC6W_11050 [Nitrosotalea sp.]
MTYSTQNFKPLSFEENNPYLTGVGKGQQLFSNMIKNAFAPQNEMASLKDALLSNIIKGANAKYAEPMAKANLGYKEAQIPNLKADTALRQLEAQFYPEKTRADIGYKTAETNKINTMTPLEAEKLQKILPFLQQREKAEIEDTLASAQYKRQGGAGAGVGAKEQMFYQTLVQKDNPHLSPEQVYEASNVLAQGGNTLSDGTKLNDLSPASRSSLDRIVKGTTTAPAITKSIQANQADAELKVLGDMSKGDFAPYATTYSGYSPQQIIDSFKSDDASQTRLGKFIASQAAQYEMAQIRNRIAGGEPGITATQELMGHSGQVIKKHFPKLSAKARQVASDRLDEYLFSALKARNAVGLHPSEIKNYGKNEKSPKVHKYNIETGVFE